MPGLRTDGNGLGALGTARPMTVKAMIQSWRDWERMQVRAACQDKTTMATPINRLSADGTVESLEVQILGKKNVLYRPF